MPTLVQDPDDKIDHAFDWSPWLTAGETIASATVTVTGMTIANVAHDDTTVTYRLSGGTDGEVYKVVCHVVTSTGEEKDLAQRVRVLSV